MKKKITPIILYDVMIGIMLALLAALGQKTFFQDFCIDKLVDTSMLLDVIVTQYTITFLIVSLLSLLSSHGEYVYWVDVLEQKIIAPKHLNFISMSVYAFVSMLAGTYAFWIKDVELVIVYFVIDVICLVFLTFRMIGIFFGKDRLRKRLHKKFIKEVKEYLSEPNEEKFNQIEKKLYGAYENANKLAEKKEFAQIIDTNFQLLIDISELMKDKYDNRLAKEVYRNIAKLFMVFQGNHEYMFQILNERYQPFGKTILAEHTIGMIQSALYDFFERVLISGDYGISYNYWLGGIYQQLQNSFKSMTKEMEERMNNTTMIVLDEHNYEGEVLFFKENEKKDEADITLLDMKYELVRQKLIRLSELIYKNNPYFFFDIICRYGLPDKIAKEIGLRDMICEYDRVNNISEVFYKFFSTIRFFKVEKYLGEADIYDQTLTISNVLGCDEDYEARYEKQIEGDFHKLSNEFKELLWHFAINKGSTVCTKKLLFYLNYSHEEIKRKIECNPKLRQFGAFYIEDDGFRKILLKVREQYEYDEVLVESVDSALRLFRD